MTGLVPLNRRGRALGRVGFDNFNNVLDDFFSDNWLRGRDLLGDTFKIDIREDESSYKIEAEVPGLSKEEVDLNVDGDDLTISINRKEETKEESENYIHRERRMTSMARRLRLANANLEKVEAKLEDGVLSVTVPKTEPKEATKKIEIQ